MEPDEIAALARDALLVEARLTPKPGLVDAANSGAHDDMDLAALEASARALTPSFAACAAWGRDDGNVRELSAIGLAGEAAMRRATAGVNTHKGALFALGLWAAARGRTDDIVVARACVANWARQLRAIHVPGVATAGERSGVGGARGQAEAGYPLVFDVVVPTLRREPGDGGLLRALVGLMAVNDDTNLLHRGGPEGLRDVQSWARGLLEAPTEALPDALAEANTWFLQRRLSPGGSADLLALGWFVERLWSGNLD